MLYASADSEVNQDAIHGTVYLQCQNAACDVYFEPQNLNLGSDAQALAAMRLGLKITSSTGTQNLIFKLDALGTQAVHSPGPPYPEAPRLFPLRLQQESPLTWMIPP